MKELKSRLAMIVLGAMVCGNSHALTGNQLYQRCAAVDASLGNHATQCNQALVNTVMCRWYVLGIADALIEAEKICPSQSVLDQQLALGAKAYLSNHPESLEMDAAELVEEALIDAYPCK